MTDLTIHQTASIFQKTTTILKEKEGLAHVLDDIAAV